jgi:enoyl-CoA hydratase/carnithine racemase
MRIHFEEMKMPESPLLLQCEPPVATVVLNRPEARNALNEAMQRALPLMLEQLRENADIRVLILRGQGVKRSRRGTTSPSSSTGELHGIGEPAAIAAALYDTKDFHAGVQAFLSKQPLPPFHGR